MIEESEPKALKLLDIPALETSKIHEEKETIIRETEAMQKELEEVKQEKAKWLEVKEQLEQELIDLTQARRQTLKLIADKLMKIP